MKFCNLRHILHRGMVDDTKQIRKYCNLCRVSHHGMVDDMKQIKKSCNVYCLFVVVRLTIVSFSIIFCNCLCMVNDMRAIY